MDRWIYQCHGSYRILNLNVTLCLFLNIDGWKTDPEWEDVDISYWNMGDIPASYIGLPEGKL